MSASAYARTLLFQALAIGLPLIGAGAVFAALPAGLDNRSSIGAYLGGNMPTTPGGARPTTLSATGAFSNTAAMTPHAGLVPYGVNSPFWTDGAAKSRWIGLPYDGGAPGSAGAPQIGFSATGNWAFPNGTVFVKHFEIVVNEQTNAKRRMETRILVRDANGAIYGNSYRWRGDNTDADIVTSPANETLTITNPDGATTREQTYFFPGPNDCTRCHNDNGGTGYTLGVKTRQLNGGFTYTATGRTDNQIHTWNHLGMLSGGVPDQTDYPQYDKLVAVDNVAATLEHRVRSYLDANCAQCHRPGGEGPLYDGRFETPILNQNLVGDGVSGSNALVRYNIGISRIHVRDGSTGLPMPPIGRNVLHQAALDTQEAWVNYPYDVTGVFTYGDAAKVRIKFDRPLDPATAAVASNYALNNGATVNAVVLEADRRVVTLTTSALSNAMSYNVTVNRVKELQTPQNPIWPNTLRSFTPQAAPAAGLLEFSAVAYDAREGMGFATIRVNRSVGGTGAVSVSYGTDNGTATAGTDYATTAGVLNWANGDMSPRYFNVPLTMDTLAEGSETINLFLSNATGGAAIGANLSAVLTVMDGGGRADFNADGRSDILWHNSATGMLYELQMNGFAVGPSAVIDQETDLNWKVVAVADLNGDGKADVVWQNTATGQVYGLIMNGTTVAAEGPIYVEPNTNWKIVGAGDFNGDGKADLLWKNDATGDVFMLGVNGLAPTGGFVIYSEPNVNWQIQKVADFNADGRADILWRNVATGDVFVLLMNGGVIVGGGVIYSEPNTNWQIQAAADFNGDGRSDILWRNVATGDVFMMLMNGTTITGGSVFYSEPNADWKIVATGDYNGDGRADILWRNTATGQVFMMLMNGFTISSGGFVYTEPNQSWKILGP
jgi:hypothetical protein